MAAYCQEPNQAQDVVRCKICENDDVEYFMHCKNCGDNVCPQCNEEHKKYFANHVIVPYSERQFAGERCMEHPIQFYDAGCKDQYVLNANFYIIKHIKIQVLRKCVNLQEKSGDEFKTDGD